MITPEDPNDDRTLSGYVKNHARETITYVLLVLGIILLFFQPFYGGFLVGLITGIYFSQQIVEYVLNWKKAMEMGAIPKNLIILGIVIALLISAPAIFLGAAFAIAIKQLFLGQSFDK